VTPARGVAGVEQQLGIGAIGVENVRIEDHAALGGGLDIVLEAGGRGRDRGAGGRGML
jgi:hypothetical protein